MPNKKRKIRRSFLEQQDYGGDFRTSVIRAQEYQRNKDKYDALFKKQQEEQIRKIERKKQAIKKSEDAEKKQHMDQATYEEYRNKKIYQQDHINEGRKESALETIINEIGDFAGAGTAFGTSAGTVIGGVAGGGVFSIPAAATGAGIGAAIGAGVGTVTGLVKGIYDVIAGEESSGSPINPLRPVSNLASIITDPLSIPVQSGIDWARDYNGIRTEQDYTSKAINDASAVYAKKHPEQSVSASNKDKQTGKSVDFATLTAVDNAAKKQQEMYDSLLMTEQEKYDRMRQAVEDSDEQRLLDKTLNGQKPEGYGLFSGTYWKDVQTKFLMNLNEAQRDSYLGQSLRGDEVRQNIKLAKINEEISDIKDSHWMLSKYLANPSDSQLKESVRKKFGTTDYAELKNVRDQLAGKLYDARHFKDAYGNEQEYTQEELDKASRFMSELAPGELGHLSTAISSFLDEKITPYINTDWWSTPVDEFDALRNELYGYNDMNSVLKKAVLDKYDKAISKKQDYWKRAADVNQKTMDSLERDHKITNYFDYMERHADGFIGSGDVWMYKMPGLTGSSTSSWVKLLPGNLSAIANVASYFVPGMTQGVKAAVGLATINATGLAGGISAGRDENYAELASNYKEQVQKRLQSKGSLWNDFIDEGRRKLGYTKSDNVSDEVIMQRWMAGDWHSNNQDVNEQAINSLKGLGSLFQNDMAAVTTDEVIDAGLRLTPIRPLIRGGKAARVLRYMDKAMTPFDSTIGPVAGGIQSAAMKTLKAAADTKFGKEFLDKTSKLTNLVSSIPRHLMSTKAGKIFDKTAGRMYRATHEWAIGGRSQAAKDYWYNLAKPGLKQTGKNWIKSGFSEGIEEGKQYMHGQEYQSGEYADDTYKSYLNVDRLLRDSWDGTKSALVALGVPFGLAFSTDDELVENIKGGMLGGLFQTGAMSTGQTAVNLLYNRFGSDGQYKFTRDLINQGILEKMAMRDSYMKAVEYAKDNIAGREKVARTLLTFDRLIKLNQDRPDAENGLSPEMLKETKKLYSTVAAITNPELLSSVNKNSRITQLSEAMHNQILKYNIDPKSEEYAKFIGMVTMSLLEAEDAERSSIEKQKSYNDTLNKFASPYEIDDNGTVNFVQKGIIDGLRSIQRRIIKPETDEQGHTIEGQELLKQKESEFKRNLSLLTNIAALMQLGDEINAAASNNAAIEGVSKDLKFIHGRLTTYLDELLSYLSPEVRDRYRDNAYDMIKDLEGIDDLIASARSLYLSKFDNDYATTQYMGITGQFNQKDELTEDEKKLGLKYTEINPLDLIKQIEDSIKEDKLLNQRIQDDFDDMYLSRKAAVRANDIERRRVAIEADEAARKENLNTKTNDWIPTVKARKGLYSAQDMYEAAYKIAKKVKETANIAEALEVLKKSDLHFAGNDLKIFGDRLSKLYEDYKAGKISRKEFAQAFVENDKRQFLNNSRVMSDGNGNYVEPRKSRRKYERGKKRPKQKKNKGNASSLTENNNPVVATVTVLPEPEPTPQPTPAGLNTTPAPASDPAALAAATAKQDSPLQTAYDQLINHVQNVSDMLLKDADGNLVRTGHDYFLTIDGKVRMFTRVHGVIEPQYSRSKAQQDVHKSIVERLNKALETSVDAFIEEAKKIAEENQSKHPQPIFIDPYFDYIKDNMDEKDDIIEAIADIVAYPVSGESVNVGNMFDEICRNFFGGTIVPYEDAVFYRYGIETPVSQFMSKLVYEDFLKELAEWKAFADRKHWKLVTEPAKFYSEFWDSKQNKVVRVCGETDMIAIDQDGNYHIIDFKTSKCPFHDQNYTTGVYNAFEDSKPHTTRNGSVRRMSSRQHYSNQLTMYYLMMKNNLQEGDVIDASIFPIWVGFRLDSNDRLIESNEDKDKSVYKGTNKNDNGKKLLIKLEFNPALTGRFLNEQPNQRDYSEDVHKAELYSVQFKTTEDKVNQESDKLQSATKDKVAELRKRIDDFIRYLDFEDNLDDDYIDSEFDNIQSEMETLDRAIDDEIKEAETNAANNQHQLSIDSIIAQITDDDFMESQTSAFGHQINVVLDTFDLTYQELRDYLRQITNGNMNEEVHINQQQKDKIVGLRDTLRALAIQYRGLMDETQLQRVRKTIEWIHNNVIVDNNEPADPNANVNLVIPIVNIDPKEGDSTWRSMTTTWKRSIESSVDAGGSGLKLSEVSGNPDFIEKSRFVMSIRDYEENGRKKSTVQVTVTYNGVTFTPVDVHVAEGSQFFKELRKYLNAANGRNVVPVSVSRTNGRFVEDGEEDTLVKKGLVSEQDLWKIEFSQDQKDFGMTQVIGLLNGAKVVGVVVPGSSPSVKIPVYQYSPDNKSKPKPGLMVYMMERDYDEVIGPNPRVPLNMLHTRLSKEDADLVIDILLGKYVSDKNTTAERMLDQVFTDGIVPMGLTNRQVLNMLINYGNVGRKLKDHVHLRFDQNDPRKIHIIGNVEGDPEFDESTGKELMADREFDLFDQESLNNLREFLTTRVDRHIDWNFMQRRINDNTTDVSHPLAGLRKALTSDGMLSAMFKRDGKIQFGNSSIVFEKSDLINPDNAGDSRGISGLAWYIKHGFFTTTASGMDNTLLNFDHDAGLTYEQPATQVPAGNNANDTMNNFEDAAAKQNAPYLVAPDVDEEFGFEHNQRIGRRGQVSEQTVKEHLIALLGKDFVDNGVTFEQSTYAVISKRHYVGLCTADAITIWSDAQRGTEYHEAFHRVMEFILSDKEYDKIKEEYRNKLPWRKNADERAVSENLAELFRSYMNSMDIINDIKSSKVRKLFHRAKRWITMWRASNSAGELFKRINAGEFKDVKPTKEALARVKRIYDGKAPMEIGGRKFNHITDHNITPLIKGVTWMMFRSMAIDKSGRDIEQKFTAENLTRDAVLKMKYIQQALTDTGIFKNPEFKLEDETKECIKEFFENWDVFKDELFTHISSFSSDYREVSNKENREKDGDPKITYQNRADDQKMDRTSNEFSHIDRASKRIKHMFSRITKMDRVDGKLVFVKNELGLPEYYSYTETLSLVLNQMHDCQSTNELLAKIKQLIPTDPLYEQLYKYVESIVESAKTNPDDMGLLLDLRSLVRSHKEDLYQIRVDGSGNFLFEACSSEYNAREYASRWSNALAYGNCEYIELGENGSYRWKVNPKTGQPYTSKVIQNLYQYIFGRSNVAGSMYGIKYAFSDQGMQAYNTYMENVRKLDAKRAKNPESVTQQDYFNLLQKSPVTKIIINGRVTALDVTNQDHLLKVKSNLVQIFNNFGIDIERQVLDTMLLNRYGFTDHLAMLEMFNDTSIQFDRFGQFMQALISKDGSVAVENGNMTSFKTRGGKEVKLDDVFNQIGFVRELGNQAYKHSHLTTELSSFGMNDNRSYTITENNQITDYVDDIARALSQGIHSEYVDNIMGFAYNMHTPKSSGDITADPIGSIVCKQLNKRFDEIERENEKIAQIVNEEERELAKSRLERSRGPRNGLGVRFINFAGMKTESKENKGTEYDKLSKREDYISKCDLLAKGYLLFPTMSDKKTWGILSGITLPGIDYKRLDLQQLNEFTINGELFEMTQIDSVLEQMLEYALTEDINIVKTLNDVHGGRESDGTEHPVMDEDSKIKNYHKGTKIKVVTGYKEVEKDGKKVWEPIEETHTTINGARYFSLTGVYDDNGEYHDFNKTKELVKYVKAGEDDKGNPIMKPVYRWISEEENRENAYKWFYGNVKRDAAGNELVDENGQPILETPEETRARQKRLIQNNLNRQMTAELNFAESLGLIERVPESENLPHVFQYINVGLPKSQINALASRLRETHSDKGFSEQMIQSIAIASFLNDISVKHIMSLQEVERIVSGHPGFYKCIWNDRGELIDRTTDQHKRLGGLVSTGKNNVLDVADVPTHYTCAEVDNEMVQSSAIDSILEMNLEGEIRQAYLDMMFDKYNVTFDHNEKGSESRPDFVQKMHKMSLDEVKAELEKTEEGKIALLIAIKKANTTTDKFRLDPKRKLDGIDVADGGAYVTDDMCEKMLKMVGPWDKTIQDAFEILRGNKYSTKEIRSKAEAYNIVYTSVIGAQKYTAYGFRMQNGVLVPYYNKMALFPLFKCMATGKTANIYEKMKKQKIDMLMVNSAVKLGSEGSKPLRTTGDDVFDENIQFHTYQESFANLRKQFNTDPKEDEEERAVTTQMIKVALSALMPGRDYLIDDGTNEDGTKKYRKLVASELRNEIMESINRISELGLEEFNKEFKDKDGNLDMKKFGKFIRKELSGRGASREMIDAFSIVTERDGKKLAKPEFKVPMVAAANMNWLQSILVAKVNKHTIDIDVPGHAFIQRSVWGMEGATQIVGDDNLPDSINNGNELKMVNEEGSMDCVLSIDFFEDIFEQYPKLKGQSFEAKKQFLINHGIISGFTKDGVWHNATANIIGSRVPTQAVSSIHALRCVDVLPIVRDTVVLPKEFTKITGSDFDIDKLYLNRLIYKRKKVEAYVDEKGKEHTHKLTCDFEEGTMDYHKNRLLRNYIAALKDLDEEGGKTRSMHKLHSPIDGDTELLTDIVEDLYDIDPEHVDPYQAYTLRDAVQTKDEFMSGKQGIGPYALNNNNQILTMLYGVEFKKSKDSILTIIGLDSLHRTNDIDGKPILSWLSGLINAHVDVAKDPYISKLNVNKFTWNIVSLLIRTGLGKQTFYYLKQPIMEGLAEAVNNADGTYMQDTDKSAFVRKQEAEQKYILEFINANIAEGLPKYATYEDAINAFEKHLIDKLDNKNAEDPIEHLCANVLTRGTNIGKGRNILYHIAKNHIDIHDKSSVFNIDGKNYNMFEIQMISYITYLKMKGHIDAISDLVQYSKIDTKKHGKNILEQKDFLKGYNKVFSPYSKSPSHFLFKQGFADEDGVYHTSGFERMRDMSYIGTKTKIATDAFKDLLGLQIIEATNAFDRDIYQICEALNVEDGPDKKLRQTIGKSILGYIKSKYMFQKDGYCDKWGIEPKGLVNGKNTIAHKLTMFMQKFANDPEYAGMLDANGKCVNDLFNVLVPAYHRESKIDQFMSPYTQAETYDDVHLIKIPDFSNNDAIKADNLTQAWLALLNDTKHPELQQFARELIAYAFITSADNGGQHDLCKYIPNEWKINPDNQGYAGSYSEYMDNILKMYQAGDTVLSDDEIDDIIRNNWYQSGVIPYASQKGFTSYYTGTTTVSKTTTSEDGKNKYTLTETKKISYPTILVGYTVSNGRIIPKYDRECITCPRYIRMNRNSIKDKQSSKRTNLYKLIGYGDVRYVNGEDEHGNPTYAVMQVPIYALTETKGNKFIKGHAIYEYARSDRSGYSEEAMSYILDNLFVYIKKLIDGMREKNGLPKTKLRSTKDILDYFANVAKGKTEDGLETYFDFLHQNLGKTLADTIESYTRYNLVQENKDASASAPATLELLMDQLKSIKTPGTMPAPDAPAQAPVQLTEEEKRKAEEIRKHCKNE